MSGDANTLYKLMILYCLSLVDYPLTNAQISGFLLEKEYTDYFTLQQVISDLVDSDFISSETIRNSSYFRITDSGRETLDFFGDKISDAIKKEIREFLRDNNYELRSEVSTPAEYFETKQGEYSVHLRVLEHSDTLLDLTIAVPSEKQASEICDTWHQKHTDVYKVLFDQLIRK